MADAAGVGSTVAPAELAAAPATPAESAAPVEASGTTVTVVDPSESSDGMLTYKEVDTLLTRTYNSTTSNNSTICNIIAVYLKGQKLLYAEAKTHCEQKLHFLMLPSILFTVVGSVLNLTMKDTSYGTTIVSGLNAFIAFLLALVNYLKLDARAEAHRTSAYKFDKLEYAMVFSSGKAMFTGMSMSQMESLINSTEKDVREIKETNQFVLPEHIRYSYPLLCGTNVFATVKDVQTREMVMTDKLKDILNDITEVEAITPQTAEHGTRLQALKELQRITLKDIVTLRNDYIGIDKKFVAKSAEVALSKVYPVLQVLFVQLRTIEFDVIVPAVKFDIASLRVL
jgi:hypothetical protein